MARLAVSTKIAIEKFMDLALSAIMSYFNPILTILYVNRVITRFGIKAPYVKISIVGPAGNNLKCGGIILVYAARKLRIASYAYKLHGVWIISPPWAIIWPRINASQSHLDINRTSWAFVVNFHAPMADPQMIYIKI